MISPQWLELSMSVVSKMFESLKFDCVQHFKHYELSSMYFHAPKGFHYLY